MEKEEKDGLGCGVFFIGLLVVSLFFFIMAMTEGLFAKEPKEVIQTYEVTYINGLKEIVSYKVHEGAYGNINSNKGSYYLSFYYENVNIFGFKYTSLDYSIAGIVSCKRVK